MGIAGILQGNVPYDQIYQNNKTSGNGTTQTFSFDGVSKDNDAVRNEDQENRTQPIAGIKVYRMEGRITSNVIGLGALADGTTYSASYAADSTAGDPVIEIRMQSKNGKTQVYQVSVNQVDPSNASQLEMFALCAHADAQMIAGCSKDINSYHLLLRYAQEGGAGGVARNATEFLSDIRDWSAIVTDQAIDALDRDGKVDSDLGKTLQGLLEAMKEQNAGKETAGLSETQLQEKALLEKRQQENNGVPYGYLAKDGIIEYNGVVFVCDPEHNAIHLGDTSNPKNCIRIPLSKGGCLIVNRDNLGDLAKAIGMFSPEDVRRILEAIAQDAKVQQMQHEIDEETSGIDLAKQTQEDEEGVQEIDGLGNENTEEEKNHGWY